MRRDTFISRISKAFRANNIVAILGPRQCGKTTLARAFIKKNKKDYREENYFDLEDTTDLSRLANPKLALEDLKGIIVIDEIQRRPDLFPILRVLIDNPKSKQQYLILGSASQELIKQSSETLAGRIGYLELTPFSLSETVNMQKLWLRGGFPKSYLAQNEGISYLWREQYIRTFLEQDIPNLGIRIPSQLLRRFWMMLAHYHGNIFNASEIGRSLALTHKTIQHYADILSGTFMIRMLHPWHENISKRQVKAPKIYFRDSGIFHRLLGILNNGALLRYPKLGASWEGFAVEEIIRHHHATPEECYFWATHGHAELDLMIIKNGKRFGFEIKYSEAPTLTKSMLIALEDLKLDRITVIYPGKNKFKIHENIIVIGLEEYIKV